MARGRSDEPLSRGHVSVARQLPKTSLIWGSQTLVSLHSRLKELLGPVTRATKKKKKSHELHASIATGTTLVWSADRL